MYVSRWVKKAFFSATRFLACCVEFLFRQFWRHIPPHLISTGF